MKPEKYADLLAEITSWAEGGFHDAALESVPKELRSRVLIVGFRIVARSEVYLNQMAIDDTPEPKREES